MSLLLKAHTLIRAAKLRTVTLGRRSYRVRGIFVNAPALRSGAHEPWLDRIYEVVLGGNGAFLDVGANVGQTMFKILSLQPDRQYIGFEPQVACSFLIEQFIRDNRLTNCSIFPFGLSNQNCLVKLHSDGGEYDSKASIIDNFRPPDYYAGFRWVPVRRGDDVLAELGAGTVAAIKIDVEGAELEVVNGLSKTIEHYRPYIVFEVLNFSHLATGRALDHGITAFRQVRTAELERLLRAFGYEIFGIGAGELRALPKIDAAPELARANYLAAPVANAVGTTRLNDHAALKKLCDV